MRTALHRITRQVRSIAVGAETDGADHETTAENVAGLHVHYPSGT